MLYQRISPYYVGFPACASLVMLNLDFFYSVTGMALACLGSTLSVPA